MRIAEILRFGPSFDELRELVREGEVDKLRKVWKRALRRKNRSGETVAVIAALVPQIAIEGTPRGDFA